MDKYINLNILNGGKSFINISQIREIMQDLNDSNATRIYFDRYDFTIYRQSIDEVMKRIKEVNEKTN